MTLELTNQQAVSLAQATNLGETRGMHVAMTLWPLIRDMVLGEVEHYVEASAAATSSGTAARILDHVRAMKGEQPAGPVNLAEELARAADEDSRRHGTRDWLTVDEMVAPKGKP